MDPKVYFFAKISAKTVQKITPSCGQRISQTFFKLSTVNELQSFLQPQFQHQQQNQQPARGQKVIVTDGYEVGLENKGALSRGATLATLDRRPNRPPFHHMGPPPGKMSPCILL